MSSSLARLILLQHNTLERRSNTFNDVNRLWPHERPSAQQMMSAGFYLLNIDSEKDDEVGCYTCKTRIYAWEKNDDPYEMHLQLSPKCEWLKKHHEELMLARKFECRRCPAKFPSNTKLHDHIRTKHSKKPRELATQSPPASSASPASTSKKSISWSEIAARPKPTTPSRIPVASPRPQQSTNDTAESPSIASAAKHMTMKDLYQRFDKASLQ